MTTRGEFGQRAYGVRFDWGVAGARATAADTAVIVDVLSFSTAVCVAVERGMSVYPYPWRDAGAEAFAEAHGAVLAAGRMTKHDNAGAPKPSLSPAVLLVCAPVERLVLPSPNGSTIAAALQDSGAAVMAGCLRNAEAVAVALALRLARGESVAVIGAGERWDDGSLRPALEDGLGAGAILAALGRHDFGGEMSPEARVTADQFSAVRSDLTTHLAGCVSARELVGKGFADDVEVAAELNASRVVPVMTSGAFGGS